MRSFKDRNGREWPIDITVAAARRVRDRTGVNLYALAEDGFKGLAALAEDVFKLCDVIFVLCEPGAKAAGVTDEMFGEALAGDTLADAADAFQEALFDFFPDPAGRSAARKMVSKGREIRTEIMRRAEAEIDGASVETLLSTLNAKSGSSPGSSASTPAPTPSASST